MLISSETVLNVLVFDNTAYCNKSKRNNRNPERALVGWNWKHKYLQLIYLVYINFGFVFIGILRSEHHGVQLVMLD